MIKRKQLRSYQHWAGAATGDMESVRQHEVHKKYKEFKSPRIIDNSAEQKLNDNLVSCYNVIGIDKLENEGYGISFHLV